MEIFGNTCSICRMCNQPSCNLPDSEKFIGTVHNGVNRGYNRRMKRTEYLPSILPAVLALLVFMVPAGCKNSTPTANTTDQSASTQPAAADQSAAQSAAGTPAAAGQASKPAAAAKAPAPMAPKPVKVTLTVDAGNNVHVRINETINAKTANVGDPFTGVLTEPLTTKDGQIVIPKGVNASGAVVAAKGQGKFAGSGVLAIELREVGGHAVSATEYVVSQKGKGKRSATFIGGGAAVGALIGGLAGGGKGAAIGGATGAGAGTAGAAMTGNKALVIPTESIVSFELSQPISVMVEK
jgi:hypothetical protein